MKTKKVLITLIIILSIILNTFCYADTEQQVSSELPAINSPAAILIDNSTRTSFIFKKCR